jgi:small subunit ribosomal protein S1
VVKNLTDYGAFVDLGGIDGLLHVTDISHGRIAHPSEALQVGDPITVKVLKLDREKERISLGLKQVTPDPWSSVVERYQPGTRVEGRVVSITDYGAFVDSKPASKG